MIGPGRRALVLLGLVALAVPETARAGAFLFADEPGDPPGKITHPMGYTGAGGVLQLTLCVRPGSPNALAMEASVRNVVRTVDFLIPATGNLVFDAELTGNELDFESVLLHEVGHCLGLAHSNLASESNFLDPEANYTKTQPGSNGTYDIAPGADAVIASDDDLRGDDVPVHWFRKLNNDPFTIGAWVDASTYSRFISDLPPGDFFAASADREVAALLGYPPTEAVMNQGTFFREEQRRLGHDDVATLRLAMAGLDEVANTADDYAIDLDYVGLTASCDIPISFNNVQSDFAVSVITGVSRPNGHHAISQAEIFFNTGYDWYFASDAEPVPALPGPLLVALGLGLGLAASLWGRLSRERQEEER